jgi:hypothetical protein
VLGGGSREYSLKESLHDMASSAQYYYNANMYAGYHARQEWSEAYTVQTERVERLVVDTDVVPGRILWLPSREELPERAVRRAHGKGAVEDGIYQHPVVVVAKIASVVHFQLVSNDVSPG